MMLVGEFDGEERVLEVPTQIVPSANTKMILGSFGRVYAPRKTVPYLNPDQIVFFDRHFMERWDKHRKDKEGAKPAATAN